MVRRKIEGVMMVLLVLILAVVLVAVVVYVRVGVGWYGSSVGYGVMGDDTGGSGADGAGGCLRGSGRAYVG